MFLELLLLALTVLWFVWKDRKPKLMPPGPWEIPFIGQIPNVTQQYLSSLQQQYGDLVTVRTGAIRTVLVFKYDTAKDLLNRQELSSRPGYLRDFMVDDKMEGGVAMSNGPQWAHDRRFMLRNLRKFGMGKTYLEDAINIEAKALVEHLLGYGGEPVKVPNEVKTAALNVIWQMMASRRFDFDDKDMNAIWEAWQKFLTTAGMGFMMKAWFPILHHLPMFLQSKIFSTDSPEEFKSSLVKVVNDEIDAHEKCFDPENLKDLVDEYLYEMKAAEKLGAPHKFRRGALAQIIGDGFDAGSDTINFTMHWVIHMLVRFPEDTTRMQQLIDTVAPDGKQINFDDKKNLALVESFVTEVIRFSSFATQTFERITEEAVEVEGYTIAKGTLVRAVTHTCQLSETFFTDPKEFKHDRFLDEEDKFQTPKEGIILFGSGRRNCPGETLAKAEVFLFTCALLQDLDISPAPGTVVDPVPVDIGGFGFMMPMDQPLVYNPRK